MADYFNLTGVISNSSSNIVQLGINVDREILGGTWIGSVILMIIFCVFFFGIKSKGSETIVAFAVSCWMVSLLAILLRGIGWLSDYQWYIALMMTPIAIISLWIARSE